MASRCIVHTATRPDLRRKLARFKERARQPMGSFAMQAVSTNQSVAYTQYCIPVLHCRLVHQVHIRLSAENLFWTLNTEHVTAYTTVAKAMHFKRSLQRLADRIVEHLRAKSPSKTFAGLHLRVEKVGIAHHTRHGCSCTACGMIGLACRLK